MTRQRRRGKGSLPWATVAVACVLAALVPLRVSGQDAPVEVTPEITAKVNDFFKQVDHLRRPRLDQRMTAEIQDVAAFANLGPDAVKALQTAAAAAEDAAQAEQWANQCKVKPAEYAKQGTAALQSLETPEMLQAIANAPETIPYTAPAEQPVWKDALVRALTPDQVAAWKKTKAEREDAARKEIDTFLEGALGQYRSGREGPMIARGLAIVSGLNLPKDRADQINALATKAVDASMDRWHEEATKSLLKESPAQRSRTMKSRAFYLPYQQDDSPEKLAVWTDGIAKLLTEDERARLKSVADAQRVRRVRAMAQLMVGMLDREIAFTATQRTALQPVAERLVQTQPELFPDPSQTGYYQYTAQTFYSAAAAARTEEVHPLLDDTQWKHWQEIGRRKNTGQDEAGRGRQRTTPAISDDAPPGEPEDMEQTVSDYLRTQAAVTYDKAVAPLILQAEDAARVAGLSEPNAAHLQTAARGVAEAKVSTWLSSVEPGIHSMLQGATAQTLRQTLANFGRYSYAQQDSKSEPIWEAATKVEMTPAQLAAWQKERDARSEYSDAAIAEFLLAEFDRKTSLSTEQWNQLTPLLTKTMAEYGPDISRMFSYNDFSQWYLMSYYMFLPFHALPEKDLKALLSKQQWDSWTGSSEYGTSATYFENIRSNHEARKK